MPGSTAMRSPSSTVARTRAFVAWSSATTPAATRATRPHAPSRMSALDEADDDVAQDVQHEDRDDRAEVDRPERRDEPPEHGQIRLAHVAQESEDGARPPR